MSTRKPPAIAMWLLHRFGMGYHGESLAGDLIEQYQQGGSAYWCWKQVIVAVVVARVRFVRDAFGALGRTALRWMRRPGRRRRVINRLIGAFVATALGAGAVTWAGTIATTPCRAAVCVCNPLSDQEQP